MMFYRAAGEGRALRALWPASPAQGVKLTSNGVDPGPGA